MERSMRAGGRGDRMCWNAVAAAAAAAALVLAAVCGEAATEPGETAALEAIRGALIDPRGSLKSWQGRDPCSARKPWAGVFCEMDRSGVWHIVELRLFQLGLQGTLSEEVGKLPHLYTLNLMWNNITGGIPPSVGQLANLQLLLVNGNHMTGPLPPELGRLSKLARLQIDQNDFSGSIPAEFIHLTSVQHLHMNNNSLSGQIPPGLGRLPRIIHILLDGNQLSGTIPGDLAVPKSRLQILQLDNNPFDPGQHVPSNFTIDAPALLKLSMRNCNLAGPVPELRGAPSLKFLDLSSNKLTGGLPDAGALANLTSALLSSNALSENISGLVLGPLPSLQTLFLADNNFTGEVDVAKLLAGAPRASSSSEPGVIIDMQRNSLSSFAPVPDGVSLWLAGNDAICGSPDSAKYTQCHQQSEDLPDLDQEHQEQAPDCPAVRCDAGAFQAAKQINDVCFCLYPVSLRIRLKSPSFTLFLPLQGRYTAYLATGVTTATNGTVSMISDQVGVQGYQWEVGPRVVLDLHLFPPGGSRTSFSRQQVDALFFVFSNWRVRADPLFGPQEFLSWDAGWYAAAMAASSGSSRRSRTVKVAVGAVVGGVVVAVLVTAAVVWLVSLLAYRYRASRGKGAGLLAGGDRSGDRDRSGLVVTGVREFSFEELCEATAMFGEERQVGQGGYGRVYRGEVAGLGPVAVKRAQEGSLQGSREFYTEIELLSRLHHRNLVRLLGFCDDRGEQMLVYEFMEGGTLKERLRKGDLDLAARIRIAIGSARGIAYLHNEAHAPIFHRDIKASNILLDARGNAKVADLGLSRAAPEAEREGGALSHVSTVCKGTPGYMDPEYFLTHKLTDKSDVYSFGVVVLELATGQPPILQGQNIVRHVKAALEAGTFLAEMVDPRMPVPAVAGAHILESLARLGLRCCRDDPDARPNILEVVRDLEVMLPWAVSTDAISPGSGPQTPSTPSGPYSALAPDSGSVSSVDHFVAAR